MNPDDEKRLAEIREQLDNGGEDCMLLSWGQSDWLIAKLDKARKDLKDLERFTGQTVENMRRVQAWVDERAKESRK